MLFDVPHRYKTQKIGKKVAEKDPKTLEYCLEKYKTLKMCNQA